jgi:tubulin polyglutamylase TTLL9
LIDGHKFVFRLFALVTSFSPLRVQLYHDGLIFYTFTEYTVANQTAKRSYISDYFFTEKQSDYYVLVQDYLTNLAQQTHYKTTTNHGGSGGGSSSKSQVGGEPQAKQLWDDIKSVVVKSLVATLKWTGPMEATKSSPGTTYEIFGYDIVLDDDLNPFLCEINETPNMGLEVNYHGDYNGLGA